MGFFLRYVTVISVLIFAVGIILLLLSHFQILGQPGVRDFLRDIGIAFCSTGLISTAYELLIRDQLLDDHERRIKALLNPDSQRLGILRIFKNRGERGGAEFGMDHLLQRATDEIVIYGIAPAGLLTDRRKQLIDFVNGGKRLRVLIANASGPGLDALDRTLSARPGSVPSDVNRATQLLREIRDAINPEASARLQIKVYDAVPPFSVIGVDMETRHATFIVELNGLNVGDGDHPSLVLERRAGGLFDFYRDQVDAVWDGAQPLPAGNGVRGPQLAERGVVLGTQSELYSLARELCTERNITKVVYYHYSGQILIPAITELLQEGVDVQLYVQSPATASVMKVDDQEARIANGLNLMRKFDKARKDHLTVSTSAVPNTVRAGVFGDDFLILGWYVYAALRGEDGTARLPQLQVEGHTSFGVLIESSNASFKKALTFLDSYRSGLMPETIVL